MRRPLSPALVLALVAALTVSPSTAAADTDIGRPVLPEGDGWASAGGGTTGGAAATAANVFRVSTPAEFRTAIAGDQPKIVYVDGSIDANTDSDGTPLTCDDYAVDGYSLEAYLAAYDPEVWGWEDPSGPLEEARQASQAVQAERIRYRVGSNTTIVGVDDRSEITGMNLLVQNARNVILRNLTFSDTHDCFPGWDPGDGGTGNWNSEYDHVEVSGSRNVWVDHNTFDDGERPGAEQPEYFGRKYEVHDGLLDIVRATDLVTVSWNHFAERDKALLLGNSDGRTTDRGYLRVTWHHNHFDGLGQRAPRVRFGQVHVYNNLYTVSGDLYQYSLGAGVESQLYVENNLFDLRDGHAPGSLLYNWGGTDVTGVGNAFMTGGGGRIAAIDLVAEHNAARPDRPLGEEVTWVPRYTTGVQPVHALRGLERKVGAGLL
ncbi:pectate lyase [Nocardiopsis sp. N85]|uniref:pectate lyase family protein n=1 Tax=Nocardiopsis sp. N85 TaxID=3029400 RepID=UPI00237EFFA5|nr:pectate lyase [Nocardiopsis sp. N85]MDE3722415.1 pectate lyase [Nocardiopsis sp. N85]